MAMDISSHLGSSYLKHGDLLVPIQPVTIETVNQQPVGQDVNAQQKICVTFSEFPNKSLVCNQTNLGRLAKLYGVDAENWIGKQVSVYRSQTSYQGQSAFGVRLCGLGDDPPDPVVDSNGVPVAYTPTPVGPSAPPTPVETTTPWDVSENNLASG